VRSRRSARAGGACEAEKQGKYVKAAKTEMGFYCKSKGTQGGFDVKSGEKKGGKKIRGTYQKILETPIIRGKLEEDQISCP